MSVESNIMEKTMGITDGAILHSYKKEELLRNYVPVVLQHIRDHGCSGLKCKRCPLNNICDRNAKNSRDLAAQMIAYAASENAIKGV